jgi:hypothetical protein
MLGDDYLGEDVLSSVAILAEITRIMVGLFYLVQFPENY